MRVVLMHIRAVTYDRQFKTEFCVAVLTVQYVLTCALQIAQIQACSCIGFAMQGIELGRKGQLCWIQVKFLIYWQICFCMISLIGKIVTAVPEDRI
jgi:hypothetical protein